MTLAAVILSVSACADRAANPNLPDQNRSNVGSVDPPNGGGNSFGATLTVTPQAAPILEGNAGTTVLNVNLEISPRPAYPVQVFFMTTDGAAKAASDFDYAKGVVEFLPGQIAGSIPITVMGDTNIEPDETFVLELSASENVKLSTNKLVLEITNDDFPASGLPARPTNSSCIAPDRPTGNASITTAAAFSDLPLFDKPIALLQAPDDSSAWYVVEKAGRVVRFSNDPDATELTEFIDIRGPGPPIDVDASESESGLLGMAFHPGYGVDNRYVFLSYTVDKQGQAGPFTSVIARFESNDNGQTLDPNSKFELLEIDQPFTNHNGGHILFGPDGFLYIHFGDGGSSGDPGDRAQNTKNLFGSILRIDVDAGLPYAIPGDNPFIGNNLCTSGSGIASCAEIYAWGLRNPWRGNFDAATGEYWVGDVGQNSFEEVSKIELGGNYGWRCREGAHDFNTSGICPAGLVDPVIEYGHSVGQSITGGFVYRGAEIPELAGRYVFADYVNGRIFASVDDGLGGLDFETLTDTSNFISSFAEDENGELLYLAYISGRIHRISQGTGSSNNTIPDLLSGTGCVDPADPTSPATGLIPYNIIVPFWSDNASKERWYAIPDGTTIDIDGSGDWLFPVGAVLMKNFRINNELFESRLFMRHQDGSWAGYTYEWNQEGTDATRVVGGKTATVQGQTWTYPSESQCMQCHTAAAKFSLGVEVGQLNTNFTYESTGLTANQISTASSIGVLTTPISAPTDELPRMSNLPLPGVSSIPLIESPGMQQSLLGEPTSLLILGYDGNGDSIEFSATDLPPGLSMSPLGQISGTPDTPGTYTVTILGDDGNGNIGTNEFDWKVDSTISCAECLDFSLESTSGFADQDSDSDFSVINGGSSFQLDNNTWRQTDRTFDITPDTIIEFTFQSSSEGEVHGIGFDIDRASLNNPDTANRIFRIYGSQNYGVSDFNTYSGPGPESFSIPVGQYYTGPNLHLVLANDDDAGIGANGTFSDIRIFDSSDILVENRPNQPRSYLHANCSGCHRPGGGTASSMDLRFGVPTGLTGTCDAPPSLTDLGIPNARIVVPGLATDSILSNRMNRRDVHGMPPVASSIADTDGVTLITDWINDLIGCP